MLIKRLKGKFGLAVCKCGHLSCDHSSQVDKLSDGKYFREYHHGGCVECSCKKFTFHLGGFL